LYNDFAPEFNIVKQSPRLPRESTINWSDENLSHPPSKRSQDSLKAAVGKELDDYTWQFKAEKFAKMLSPKIRKTLLKAHEVDTLDDYETFALDNVNTNDVLLPKINIQARALSSSVRLSQ
jgi:hypothetical protein